MIRRVIITLTAAAVAVLVPAGAALAEGPRFF